MNMRATAAPDDVALISASWLFDAEWYVSVYPDVAQIDIEPAAHYLSIGAALGRWPSKFFDPDGYLETYSDAAGQNPLLHYLKTGESAGYLPMPNGMGVLSEGNDIAPPRPTDPHAMNFMPKALARRAEAALDVPWPEGATGVYRDVRAHFDPVFYITTHFDMAMTPPGFDMARHYVRAGDKEGRAPSPHFSARAYRRRYGKDLDENTNLFHHWITVGRPRGMIADALPQFEKIARILDLDPADCQEKMIARKNDIRERLTHGVLGEMVQKATEIEPLVSRTWRQAFKPNVQPFHKVETAQRLVAMHELLEAAEFRRAKAVVCVEGPRWGSNRRMEGHLAHALAAEYGAENVAFISLDKHGELPTHKYPEGVRCIKAADLTRPLKDHDRQRVILEFLRSLRADAVFNVNSALLWKLVGDFGPIMRADVPVVGCFFCNDKSVYGTWGGYPATQFYRNFTNLKAVCTDSYFLRDGLIEQFCVPPDQQGRLHVLEAPVDPELPQAPENPPENARPQIFWASRLDIQKRLDVVYGIAEVMPHADFRLWGSSVTNSPNPEANRPDNVSLEGAYERFDELPLDEADLWLYTSEWDGVPSILLEVAMTGLPIVGSLVGGTGEVLHDGMSWPVEPYDNVDAYVMAIEEVLSDPDAARESARVLREKLAGHRTEAHYQSLVRDIVEGTDT